MRLDQRIVTTLPLTELWNAQGPLSLIRQQSVGFEEITHLLRQDTVAFIVAEGGRPLNWVPTQDRFHFWKNEVKPHLVALCKAESGFLLDDFPNRYCFLGSLWQYGDSDPVVLLEKYH